MTIFVQNFYGKKNAKKEHSCLTTGMPQAKKVSNISKIKKEPINSLECFNRGLSDGNFQKRDKNIRINIVYMAKEVLFQGKSCLVCIRGSAQYRLLAKD